MENGSECENMTKKAADVQGSKLVGLLLKSALAGELGGAVPPDSGRCQMSKHQNTANKSHAQSTSAQSGSRLVAISISYPETLGGIVRTKGKAPALEQRSCWAHTSWFLLLQIRLQYFHKVFSEDECMNERWQRGPGALPPFPQGRPWRSPLSHLR